MPKKGKPRIQRIVEPSITPGVAGFITKGRELTSAKPGVLLLLSGQGFGKDHEKVNVEFGKKATEILPPPLFSDTQNPRLRPSAISRKGPSQGESRRRCEQLNRIRDRAAAPRCISPARSPCQEILDGMRCVRGLARERNPHRRLRRLRHCRVQGTADSKCP